MVEACNDANVIPIRSRYAGTCNIRRRDRWTIWMGGAGRSGDGLQMVSRVRVWEVWEWVRMVNRVSVGGLGAGWCRICL